MVLFLTDKNVTTTVLLKHIYKGTIGELKKLLLIRKNQTNILSNNQLDFDVSYTYMYAMNEFLTAIDKRSQTSQNLYEGMKISELALRILEGAPL